MSVFTNFSNTKIVKSLGIFYFFALFCENIKKINRRDFLTLTIFSKNFLFSNIKRSYFNIHCSLSRIELNYVEKERNL